MLQKTSKAERFVIHANAIATPALAARYAIAQACGYSAGAAGVGKSHAVILTLRAEDHVPGLTRGIVAGDLSVEEAPPDVRILRFELVHHNTFLHLLGFLLDLRRCLRRDLCPDGGDHSSTP